MGIPGTTGKLNARELLRLAINGSLNPDSLSFLTFRKQQQDRPQICEEKICGNSSKNKRNMKRYNLSNIINS